MDGAGSPSTSTRATPDCLALYRILFACLLLAGTPRYQWIAQFPDSFFAPPPGMTIFFLSGFPPGWFFVLLDLTLVTALMFLLAGRRVTGASIVVTATLLIGNAWAYSFGKIDHDILLVLAPVFLAAAGWHGRSPSRAWPMALYALSIAVTMLTAGLEKATTGWLQPSSHAVLGHALQNALMMDRLTWVRLATRLLPGVAWKALDYATVMLELGFLAALPRRTWFRTVCAIACLFHLGVALMMGIFFLSNLAAYAAFVDWDVLAARARVSRQLTRTRLWLGERSDPELLAAAAAWAATAFAWQHRTGGRLVSMAAVVSEPGAMALTWIAALGGLVYLGTRARRLFGPSRVAPGSAGR